MMIIKITIFKYRKFINCLEAERESVEYLCKGCYCVLADSEDNYCYDCEMNVVMIEDDD